MKRFALLLCTAHKMFYVTLLTVTSLCDAETGWLILLTWRTIG